MKYLIPLLFLFACKKESNTITYTLKSGAGDVVITEGDLVTDFQGRNEGWSISREAKPKTRYTIECYSHYYNLVTISYNGKVVASQQKFAAYTTP